MQCVRACLVAQIVSHSATPWTVTSQVPLSLGFSRQEYCTGFPPPGNLPELGIEPLSPAFAGRFFTTELFEFEFKYWLKIRICILKSEGNERFNKKGQLFVHWFWQGFLENWSYLSPSIYLFLCLLFLLSLFFIYFYLQWILIAVHGFTLVATGWGAPLQLRCVVLSLQWLFCCRAQALGRVGSVVWCRGLVVLGGVWDPPGPRIQPTSSALAGRFSVTGPQGKSLLSVADQPDSLGCEVALKTESPDVLMLPLCHKETKPRYADVLTAHDHIWRSSF